LSWSYYGGDGDVAIGGGADVIRQALAAGKVDELVISTAPVILGAGKRLFDGFDQDMDLEVTKVYSSPYATPPTFATRSRSKPHATASTPSTDSQYFAPSRCDPHASTSSAPSRSAPVTGHTAARLDS